MSTELWRTAVHEAGHATASHLLGATDGAGPLSIIPAQAYLGTAFCGHLQLPEEDLAGLGQPWPLLPAGLKRWVEVGVMVCLAGTIAEDVCAGRGVPDLAGDRDGAGPAGPQPPAPLPPDEQARLDQASVAASPDTDLGKALRLLRAVHFDDEGLAVRHARFLTAETEALLAGRRAGRQLRLLAAELMRSRALAAVRWLAVLHEAN